MGVPAMLCPPWHELSQPFIPCPFISGCPGNTPKCPRGCHGTQGCSKDPLPKSCPTLSTSGLPCAKGWHCWGVTGTVPGVAVPGGRRCLLCTPLSHSCTMAIEELRSGRFWRGVLAELLATLIFVGVVLGASASPEKLAPALAGGLVAGGLLCTLGGPQANPALTLALLCTRKLSALRGAVGVLAQCMGATLASAAARAALQDGTSLVTRVSTVGTAGTALAWETFATFQLALAAFATSEHAAPQAGLALGSAVAAGALAAGPFSGGSMNPARSLGPAIVTGLWDDHWVYWLGPVLGAVLAGLSYEFILAPGASREKLSACLACRDVALVETPSLSPFSVSQCPPPPPPGEQGTA
ncbi:LOW QUALITY PROTEIN: aquaporin-2-like [Passerculus sandwichensis]